MVPGPHAPQDHPTVGVSVRVPQSSTMDFCPPPQPPPLLSDNQILTLAGNGWLPFPLPEYLQANLSALSQASRHFFNQSPAAKAEQYPQGEGTESGFYPVENEKEYVTLRCRVHADSEMEELAARVWSDVAALFHRILSDLAREMDMSHRIWDSLLDGCLQIPPESKLMTPSLLRLFQYYPGSGFAAKHTDLGLLTLCVGDGRGLQVVDQASEKKHWVDADGPVILVGNVLQVLSGNRIRAGVHRVVENPDGRSSIVFALRPSLRHPIDLAHFGLEGAISADELWSMIKSSKLNINATKEVRDRQRELLKARKAMIDQAG